MTDEAFDLEEHPFLPHIVADIHPPHGSRPPYARYLINTTRVVVTVNPARIRQDADRLYALADRLELVQHEDGW